MTTPSTIKVCLAGATGWAGSELARAIANFALTVVLLQKFAEAAPKLIPQWEIFDYAHDGKVDAPSGTVRELAAKLAKVRLQK